MDSRLASTITDNYDILTAVGFTELYTDEGIPYAEGDLFKNEQLADVLERIAKGGIEEFYTGSLAQEVVDGLRAGGSLITMDDMAIYTTAEREAIRTTYHGYEVVTVPPPSNGGDWLLEMLNILEHYDLKAMGFNTPEYLFTFNEASRMGLADSYAFIGDPAFYDLPIAQMVSKEYAAERVKLMPTEKVFEGPAPSGDLPVKKLVPTGRTASTPTTSRSLTSMATSYPPPTPWAGAGAPSS